MGRESNKSVGKRTNEDPLITIVTVCFNSEFTLESTIQSVLGQTYQNVEYIIIDGGSHDGTIKVIEKYRDNIDFWVSEQDGGIYDAMNKGIRNANGDAIVMLNSDDTFLPNAVEQVVKNILEWENVVTFADSFTVYNDINKKVYRKANLSLERGMCISHQTMFVSRDVYERFGGYSLEYRYASDFDFLCRTFTSGVQYKYIPYPLVNFTYGGTSDQQYIKSNREVIAIISKYLGNSKTFTFKYIFYKTILLRTAHKSINKIFGYKLYLFVKNFYVRLRSSYSNTFKQVESKKSE